MKKSFVLILSSIFLLIGCSKNEPINKKPIQIEPVKEEVVVKSEPQPIVEKKQIVIWNNTILTPLKTLVGHEESVNSVAFSPNGEFIASGSSDRTVKLWNVKSGEVLKTFSGWYNVDWRNNRVNSIAFSPNGEFLALAKDGGFIDLENVKSREYINSFGGLQNIQDRVKYVTFSPNGELLASVGIEYKTYWDSRRGKEIATKSSFDVIKIWNVKSGEVIKKFYMNEMEFTSVAFSPNGNFLASVGKQEHFGTTKYNINLWNVEGGISKTFSGHKDLINSVAFSPNGEFIASGSLDKTVKVWSVKSGGLIKTFTGHNREVRTVAFSPNGEFIASGSSDKTINLWSLKKSGSLKTFSGHKDKVNSIAFSPNGEFLVSASADNTIKIWDIKTRHKDIQKYSFKDISNSVQASINEYLTLPLVKTPILPAQKELVKSQFETKAEFLSRVERERLKREKEIASLQEKYRADVEKRNQELEKRKANIEEMKVGLTEKNIYDLFGEVLLKPLSYDAESKTAYAILTGERSKDFNEKISFQIEPNEAKNLFEKPNEYNHSVVFEYDKDGALYIKNIYIKNIYPFYRANLDNKNYKPETIKIALSDGKLESIEQNPNLIDKYETRVVEFKGDRKDDLSALVANMKQAPIDSKKWLFVFAVEKYDETDSVLYAKNSAEQFAKAMQKRVGISERNSYIYVDSKATTTALIDHLDRFLKNVKAGDSVYFYYSGHGIPDPKTGEAYLLPKDKIVDYVTKENSLKARTIYNKLSSSSASSVVAFVDSCFSGKTDNISNYKGVAAGLFRTKQIDFDKSKMTVITAGTNNQFSNAHPDKPHRLFSYYLVETMAKENKLDLDLLYSKVYTKVKDVSWKMGDVYQQEPTKEGKINLEF